MISELEIANFKSIEHLKISPKKINILIGRPNTGKSNILEALGLCSSMGHDPGNLGSYIRFDRTLDLFNNTDIENKISISINNQIEYEAEMEGSNCTFKTSTGSKDEFSVTYDVNGKYLTKSGSNNKLDPVKYYQFNPEAEFRQYLQTKYLRPPHGENLPHLLKGNKVALKYFTDIVGEFGYKPIIDVYENRIDLLREYEGAFFSTPYRLISEGIRRIIFHTIAMLSNRESVLIFEEPESNIFPFYITGFAETIGINENDNQFFISTHNPYFLKSLIEKAPLDDLNVYVAYMEDFKTRVKTLTSEDISYLYEIDPFVYIEDFISREE